MSKEEWIMIIPIIVVLTCIGGCAVTGLESKSMRDNCVKTESYVSVKGIMTPVYDCSNYEL